MDIIGLIDDGGGPWGYVAKGIHDKQEFINGITNEWSDDEIRIDEVRHCHARVVPAQENQGFDTQYLFNVKPGKGAFEVTYVEI